MPVPTTVDRQDRLAATAAHRQVADLLDVGERLAGEGRTFFANTTELYDIDDARGQVLKSPGYQALLRTIDPVILTFGGRWDPDQPERAVRDRSQVGGLGCHGGRRVGPVQLVVAAG